MAYELVDFGDLKDAVIEELKLDPNDTVEVARIARDINMSYLNSVVPAKRWPWLRGYAQKEHKPYLSNGTVAVTPDSTTITFSTAPTTSKTGYLFATDTFSEVYVISAHTANSTTATLSTPYTGTLQTAGTYKVWTDSIILPTDCRETVEVLHSFFKQPLEGVGLQEFRRRVTEGVFTQGRPEIYSTYDYVGEEDSTRYRVMKIHPSIYPNSTTLSIDYVREVSPLDIDSDEPVMPIEDRVVLVYGALERAWKRFRNTEASEQSRRDFQEKLAQMAGRVEDSQDQAQIAPSSQYLSRKRGRSSTRSVSSTGSGAGSYTSPSYLKNAIIEGATVTANITVNSGITIDGVDISALDAIVTDHIADTGGAHAASAISVTPAGALTATDVQSALQELQGEISGALSLTSSHLFVGNASNVATDVEVTGDIAIDNAGVVSISSQVIVNDDVSTTAAIAHSKMAALTASKAAVTDVSGVVTTANASAAEVNWLVDTEALQQLALADNQAVEATIDSWAHASYDSFIIKYSLKRGTANKETGTLMIATDGTTASIAQAASSLGTLGVTFSVDVSGTDVRLRYVSTSTGVAPTISWRIEKWLA